MTIRQRKPVYALSLHLAGVGGAGAYQDFGSYRTLKRAQGEAAKADRIMSKMDADTRTARRNPTPQAARLQALQQAWKKIADERDELLRALEVKYGPDGYRWAGRGERSRLDKLSERASKASDKVFDWLRENSPWDWYYGPSANWILTRLTPEMAFSPTPPMLPAESAAWGEPRVDRLARPMLNPRRRRNHGHGVNVSARKKRR